MERIAQDRRPTEEHTNIRLGVFICQTTKHSIPIRSTEMCRCPQAGDGVPICTNVRDVDILHVVLFDLRGEVNRNLNPVLSVLFFDRVQERVEPFCCTEITNDPDEVDLGETRGLGVMEVVHAVPDRFEDGSEWCDTNTGTNEKDGLILELLN